MTANTFRTLKTWQIKSTHTLREIQSKGQKTELDHGLNNGINVVEKLVTERLKFWKRKGIGATALSSPQPPPLAPPEQRLEGNQARRGRRHSRHCNSPTHDAEPQVCGGGRWCCRQDDVPAPLLHKQRLPPRSTSPQWSTIQCPECSGGASCELGPVGHRGPGGVWQPLHTLQTSVFVMFLHCHSALLWECVAQVASRSGHQKGPESQAWHPTVSLEAGSGVHHTAARPRWPCRFLLYTTPVLSSAAEGCQARLCKGCPGGTKAYPSRVGGPASSGDPGPQLGVALPPYQLCLGALSSPSCALRTNSGTPC